MRYCNIRDQRMIGQANDRTLKGGGGKRACAEGAGAGPVVPARPALDRPSPIQSARGAIFIERRALRSRLQGLRDRARHRLRSDSRGVVGCPRM